MHALTRIDPRRAIALAVVLASAVVMLSLLLPRTAEAAVTEVVITAVQTEAGLENAEYEVEFTSDKTDLTNIQVTFPVGYTVSDPGDNGIECGGQGRVCVDLGSTILDDVRVSGRTVILDIPEWLPEHGPELEVRFSITAGITNPTQAGPVDAGGFRVFVGFGGGEANPAAGVTITPGPVSALQVETHPDDTDIGATLSPAPVVRTVDEHGNPSTDGLGESLDVTASLNGSGNLTGPQTLDIGSLDGDGTVTFDDLAVDIGQTGATLTFAAEGLTSAISDPFNITCNTGIDIAGACYDTIQLAIDGAEDGDTINVGGGATYTEAIVSQAACGGRMASLCIDVDNLTLRGDPGEPDEAGSGPDAPVLNGAAGTGAAIDFAQGVSGVVIEGFQIEGYHRDGDSGDGFIRSWNTGSSNITVQDNDFTSIGNGWNGILVGSDDGSVQDGWIVRRNFVDWAPYAGIELTNVTNAEVTDNEVRIFDIAQVEAGDSGVGIEIAVRAHAGPVAGSDIVVSGNSVVDGFAGNRAGINILARAYSAAAVATLTGVTVDDNEMELGPGTVPWVRVAAEERNGGTASISALAITDNVFWGGIGVAVGVPSGVDGTYDGIEVNGNAFFGADIGVENTVADLTVDATENYWGSEDGPDGVGPGTGAEVSEGVTFLPWYIDGDLEDLSPAACIGETCYASIQAAIDAATPGATIDIGAGEYTETLEIGQDVTLQGAGDDVTIIQAHEDEGEADDRVVTITGGVVTIDGVTIEHGDTTEDGGGISVAEASTLNLNDSTVSDNRAVHGGGVALESGGTLNVTGSVIEDNDAAGSGGGISNDGGTVTIEDSVIDDNTALGSGGGGIYNAGGTVTIEDSDIDGNTALGSGGGIFNDEGAVIIGGSVIHENAADGSGGGIYNADGTVTIEDSVIADNDADSGGGIYNDAGDVTIDGGTTITGNDAFGSGGGIYNEAGELTVTSTSFNANDATGNRGGGIFNTGGAADLTVSESTFTGNFAAVDGAAIYNDGGTLSVTESRIDQNTVDAEGFSGISSTVDAVATHNWWGDDGPGDEVTANVSTFPWYVDTLLDELVPSACIENDCYPTIQAAIDAADAGDTIQVGRGEFVENLVINKPLTIAGESEGEGNTTINGDIDEGADATIAVTGVDGLTLRDLVIENSVGHAIDVIGGANVLIEDVTVEDFSDDAPVWGAGVPFEGNVRSEAIRFEDVTNATVRRATLEDNDGFIGVNCGTLPDGSGSGSTCVIEDSEITANWIGVYIAGGDSSTVTITDSLIFDVAGRGIRADDDFNDNAPLSVTVRDVLFIQNEAAISVVAPLWGEFTIDARENWWGSAGGPGAPGGTGEGDPVTAGVSFVPWYINESLENLGRSACIVDDCYVTIQEAIDAAEDGDVIDVSQSTYVEEIENHEDCGGVPASLCIDVNNLTLRGDPGDPNEAGVGPDAPALLGNGEAGAAIDLAPGVSGVVIEGFVIDEYAHGGSGNGFIRSWNTGASDITVQDNAFTDLGAGWNGILVGSDDDSVQDGWTVRGNVVDGAPYAGIELTNVTNALVTGNQVRIYNGVPVDPGDSGVGIEIAVRAHEGPVTGSGIVVSGNFVERVTEDNRAGINILARAYSENAEATLTGVTVEDNGMDIGPVPVPWVRVAAEERAGGSATISSLAITGNEFLDGGGIAVGVPDVSPGTDGSYDGIEISGNLFVEDIEDGAGVTNTVAGLPLDATENWWGDESGPGGEGPGTGAPVSENVTFDPWCIDDDCNALSDRAVQFTFDGMDGHAPGEEFEYSATLRVDSPEAAGIDVFDTFLRYRAHITRDGVDVAGQAATFPDLGTVPPDELDDPATWSTITTDEDGIVDFGPADGFPLLALAPDVFEDGVTTPFRTTFDTAGTYTIEVWLYDVADLDATPLGGAGSVTFTVAAPPPPGGPDIDVPPEDEDETPDGPVVDPVVEREDEVAAPVVADEPAVVVTQTSDGGSATVAAPANALPANATLSAAAVANIEELVAQAPPPGDAAVALAFVIEATDADGNALTEDFAEPVNLEFTVPAASVPAGTESGELVVAFWNGSEWVEVDAVVTVNADGSFNIVASVDHFTIFSVLHQPDRGTFAPAPVASGVTLATWRGGGYPLLTAALGSDTSVWTWVGGVPLGYTVGAPDFVNANFMLEFPGGLPTGTVVVVAR